MLLTSKTRSAPRSEFSSACLTRAEAVAVQPPVVDALLRQIERNADTGRTEVELAGLLLGESDEILERCDRRFRAGDDQQRRRRDLNHRDEILHGIKRQLFVDRGAECVAVDGLQNRVAIRRRFRDRVRTDVAGRSAAVVHDERLTCGFGCAVTDNPRRWCPPLHPLETERRRGFADWKSWALAPKAPANVKASTPAIQTLMNIPPRNR